MKKYIIKKQEGNRMEQNENKNPITIENEFKIWLTFIKNFSSDMKEFDCILRKIVEDNYKKMLL